jgi:arabinofuranosyltransferase
MTFKMKQSMGVVILSGATIGLGLWLSFAQDDAFILYRYVGNLLAGNGLVFNPGEWVEGYTCPFWVLILAGIGKLGLDMVLWSRFIGLGFAVGTLWLVFAIGKRLMDKDDPWWMPLIAPALLAVNGTFASFATSGLETSLFTLLLIGTTAVFITYIEQNRFPIWLALGYVLLTLTRPEGLMVFGCAWVFGLIRVRRVTSWSRSIAGMIPSLMAFLIPLMIVTTWRWLTYGYPLPNPAYAKIFLDRVSLGYGLDYLWKFLSADAWYGIIFVIAILPIVVKGLFRHTWVYLWMVFAVYSLYIVIIGGDVLKGLRFFVPLFPIFVLLIQGGIGVVWRRSQWKGSTRLSDAFVIGMVVLLAGGQMIKYPQELGRARLENGLVEKMEVLAEWFMMHQPERTSIAANSIGALGYYTGYRIVDMVGLVDETIAHDPKLVEGIRSLAKERTYHAAHTLAQSPDFVVFDTYEKPNHGGDFALYLEPGFRQGFYRYPIWMPGFEREMVVFKASGATAHAQDDRKGETYSGSGLFNDLDFIYALRDGMDCAARDPQRAEVLFEQAVLTGPPDFAQPLEWLGMLALQRGDRDRAEALFREAVAMDSFSVYAVRYLAKITFNDGKIDEAMEWSRWLIQIDPHIPDGWLMIGWIYKKRGQENTALEIWNEGVDCIGEHPGLLEVIRSQR